MISFWEIKTGINVDRDILVYEETEGKGNRCRSSRNILIPYGMKPMSEKEDICRII